MADIPADIVSGIAIGGAIVGGATKTMIDRLFGKNEKKTPEPMEGGGTDVKYMLGELVQLSRDGVELQRQSRDILTEMKGDHRVLELKLNQMIEECRR